MTYLEILDFDNQLIVDELYKRLKTEDENNELQQAYVEITTKNKKSLKTHMIILKKGLSLFNSLIDIIQTLLTSLLFFIGASFALSCMSLLFVYSINALNGFKQKMSEVGLNFITMFLPVDNVILNDIINSSKDVNYVIGLTIILFVLFMLLYVISFFKKKKIKQKTINLSKAKYFLKVDQDDSFEYIKYIFKKKVSSMKNKVYYDLYYESYLYICNHYEEYAVNIELLSKKQKILLAIRTITNSLMNILGLLAKPILIILVTIIGYYRLFGEGFMLIASYENPMQKGMLSFFGLLEKIDAFISHTPLSSISQTITEKTSVFFVPQDNGFFMGENSAESLKLYISLALLLSIIYIICHLYGRFIEIKRQYHRRLNYYYKVNTNIYDVNKKYIADHPYIFDFTILVFVVIVYYLLSYLNTMAI